MKNKTLQDYKKDWDKLKVKRKNWTEDDALEMVRRDVWNIKYISNPSEEVCLAAVEQNGDAIQYIPEHMFKHEAVELTVEENQDPIVEENVKFLRDRSNVGLKKYGVGLDRDDLSAIEWVEHLREELADALNYATVVQQKMIGKNGNI